MRKEGRIAVGYKFFQRVFYRSCWLLLLSWAVLLGAGGMADGTGCAAAAEVTMEPVAGGTRVIFSRLPQSAEEIPSCYSPEESAAMAVAALVRFSEEPQVGITMLNVLRGPRPLSNFEIQFLREKLLGDQDYVARSHFEGATPENNYTPKRPYAVLVSENMYSYTEENYARLFLTSGGADQPRPIALRKKPSTGEWFLWNHVGLLPGIRLPAAKDVWR